jgi:S-adenosylmethionine-diacylglycerol 3-amino-3-carboxypropyl transferase
MTASLGPAAAAQQDQTGIRYASVWEDADVLCQALAPVAKGGRLLSIASAGDNALALLTLGPSRVVAADMNPAQLACVELRVAAFQGLADADLAPFLGVGADARRCQRYDALRKRLSSQARAFWDGRPQDVAAGVVHAGRFERYLRFFGRGVLPVLQPGPWRKALLSMDDPAQQAALYRRRWDHPLWRGFFRVFFSRSVMGAFGRDPAFFSQVRGQVGVQLLERTRRAFTQLPAARNPYLQYIVRGDFQPQALPLYLRPAARAVIRKRLDRLRLHQGLIQDAPGGPFHGFNLSDLFEYLSPEAFHGVYAALLKQARPQARLAWWNLLLGRRSPAPASRVRRLTAEAARLHAQEKAWFYGSLELDEVRA